MGTMDHSRIAQTRVRRKKKKQYKYKNHRQDETEKRTLTRRRLLRPRYGQKTSRPRTRSFRHAFLYSTRRNNRVFRVTKATILIVGRERWIRDVVKRVRRCVERRVARGKDTFRARERERIGRNGSPPTGYSEHVVTRRVTWRSRVSRDFAESRHGAKISRSRALAN